MKKEGIILIGGGGHCRSVIDVIQASGHYEIKGILDLPGLVGEEILGHKIIGTDEHIPKYAEQEGNFLISMGQIRDNNVRKKVFSLVEKSGGHLCKIISPRAYVSPYSEIGKGTWIGHDAVINAGARIGMNCIVNSKCLVEHDAIIGEHTHLSTGAIVNGECRIGTDCFIGSLAMVSNNVTIGDRCVIGAASAVFENVEDDMVVSGSRNIRLDAR